MPIENLFTDDERRQLEAVRLIALAKDLLTAEREEPIKADLRQVLEQLGSLVKNERAANVPA